jgi:hypothetical protein
MLYGSLSLSDARGDVIELRVYDMSDGLLGDLERWLGGKEVWKGIINVLFSHIRCACPIMADRSIVASFLLRNSK